MCWPGASSISSGVTIDLGQMDKTTYDPSTKIASIQPGGRWTDVYATLDKGRSSFCRHCLKFWWLIWIWQRA